MSMVALISLMISEYMAAVKLCKLCSLPLAWSGLQSLHAGPGVGGGRCFWSTVE